MLVPRSLRLTYRIAAWIAVWPLTNAAMIICTSTPLVATVPQARAKIVQPMRPAALSPDLRLTHADALNRLQEQGIGWRSNGNCTDRERKDCTSFEGIRLGSITALIDFHRESGCPIVVSGGTERGHADELYSHYNGYKMDVMPNPCVDGFIENRYQYVGKRGDGALIYRAPNGFFYCDEHSSHWDIIFSADWRPTGDEVAG